MDLCSVFQKEPSTAQWHFVSYITGAVLWALIADIDIESEVLRFMGASRYDIWGALRILSLKQYSGSDAHCVFRKLLFDLRQAG